MDSFILLMLLAVFLGVPVFIMAQMIGTLPRFKKTPTASLPPGRQVLVSIDATDPPGVVFVYYDADTGVITKLDEPAEIDR